MPDSGAILHGQSSHSNTIIFNDTVALPSLHLFMKYFLAVDGVEFLPFYHVTVRGFFKQFVIVLPLIYVLFYVWF